ncbi:MAG: hypothetical protein ABI333_08160 [bacterium]
MRRPFSVVVSAALVSGLATLSALSSARASGRRGPVYIPPILYQETQRPDKQLSHAFHEAVALRVPLSADWRLTPPDPAVCQRGCVVVRIVGRRAPSPQYVLRMHRFPRGSQVSAARLDSPTDATPALLADALLLKTSFLVRLELSERRRAAPTATPSKPVPRKHRRDRVWLSVGSVGMLGLDGDMVSYGAELAATIRLWGPMVARVSAGYQGLGTVGDDLSSFQAVPVGLQLGAQWSWSWFELGIFGGGSLLLYLVRFNEATLGLDGNGDMTGLCGGPSGELRLAAHVHRHVSLGVFGRFTYVVNRLRTSVSGQYQTAEFEVPSLLLQVGVDLTFRF